MNRQILESIAIGIVILDSNLNVLFWNKWMESASGISAKDIVDSNIFTFFPNLDTPRFQRRVKSSLAHGNYWHFSQQIHKFLFPFKTYSQDMRRETFMQQKCTMGPVYDEHTGIEAVFITVDDVTEIVASENQLKQALKDKDLLMREVHHRVKNNLTVIQSLLSLQMTDIHDEKSKEYFIDAENRVRSMTMIHEMLHSSDNLRHLKTNEYIENLVGTLFHNYQVNTQAIKLKYDIQDIILDVDTMIPLGLIINELVSNALKYAFPDGAEGVFTVSLIKREDHTCVLTVKDTGIGLPEDLNMDSHKSLGLLIVNSLIKQINGALEVSNKGGAEFKITFTEKLIK